jgi:hypothetical protein
MPVPVAESQLSVNTASSGFATATTGGTLSTSLSRHGTAKRGADSPFRNALNAGRPQTKTMAERSTHGRHASQTTRPDGGALSSRPGVASSSAGPASRGVHHRSRRASAAIERTAETTSTSQGPWKFERRYCGTANATPATRAAGHTPAIPRRPAKAATTQNGTRTAKNGSCRPTMAERSITSSPVTAPRARIGVPSAPNATGAVFAMSERQDAAIGVKPSWMRRAAVTATGVPNPAAPSKNAPRQNAMPITWMRGSGERRARLVRRTAKCPFATDMSYRKMRLSTIQPMGKRP